MNGKWYNFFIGLFFLVSIHSYASPDEYSIGNKLAKCAGFFTFWSGQLSSAGLHENSIDAANKSNGWRIASLGAFYSDGFSHERRNSLMINAYSTAITSLNARVEAGKAPSQIIDEKISECLPLNNYQETYRQKMKSLNK